MQHSSTRYLLFFQYIGTKYSGVMKSPAHQAVEGVQNHLENAVRRLKPLNEATVFISSRTDTGVHALCNSAHLDILRKADKPPFTEKILTEALNFFLKAEPIRITRAYRVPSDFHARYWAVSRTYVYRLATGISHHSVMPITEKDLCWALRDTKMHLQSVIGEILHARPRLGELDISAMREASAVLTGTHDFSTFRALSSDAPFRNPVKTMELVQVQPGLSFSQRHFHRDIQYWELSFRSRSFLYKQVRRMTGALVAVGQGKLSTRQLQEHLDARDSTAYPQNIMAPAHGLFLTNVEYKDTDLVPYTQERTDNRT